MGPRSFRIGPADDDELLAVQLFGFTPQTAISRRVRGIDRLRDHALKAELAGVFEDKFATTRFMTIELSPWLACEQRLKNGLALNELKVRNVPTVEMQEIE